DSAHVRPSGWQEGREEHDARTTVSARQEGIRGGSEETDGTAPGAGTDGKTGEERCSAKVNGRDIPFVAPRDGRPSAGHGDRLRPQVGDSKGDLLPLVWQP